MGDSVEQRVQELAIKVTALEGHMNTAQAKTETVFERVEASIARLGKEAAERDAELGRAAAEAAKAAAKRDVAAAKRENRIVKWVVGSVAVATGVIGGVVSLLHLLAN